MPVHYPMENKVLLEKYLAGHATEAEKAIVEGWYTQELSRNEYTVNAAHLAERRKKSGKPYRRREHPVCSRGRLGQQLLQPVWRFSSPSIYSDQQHIKNWLL
jgi:hypothetical protein